MSRVKVELSEGQRFRLFMGKIRRFFYIVFRPRYVAEWRKRRRGMCRHCGACCKLAHKCLHLKTRPDGTSYCAIYKVRPPNCRAFPIDPIDLRERDIINPDIPCGYWFEGDGRFLRRGWRSRR